MIGVAEKVLESAARRLAGYRRVASVRSALAGKVTPLLYHRVAATSDREWIEKGGVPSTTPAAFEEHIVFLKRLGATFVTFRDLAAGYFPAEDEVCVIINFDDGFADNFNSAQPILDQYQISAVFFVATQLVESEECLWDHEICWYQQIADARLRSLGVLEQILGRRVDISILEWAMRHLLDRAQIQNVLSVLRDEFQPSAA